jgi:1-pyrroline-5-carboxylate dehydrogenase
VTRPTSQLAGIHCGRKFLQEVFMEKITYASLGSLGEEFHRKFDSALATVRERFGQTYPIFICGKPKKSTEIFPDASPSDTRNVLGKFQLANRSHAQQAIEVAKKAFPIWRNLGWRRRVQFLRKAADLMTKRQYEFAALLTLEVG